MRSYRFDPLVQFLTDFVLLQVPTQNMLCHEFTPWVVLELIIVSRIRMAPATSSAPGGLTGCGCRRAEKARQAPISSTPRNSAIKNTDMQGCPPNKLPCSNQAKL